MEGLRLCVYVVAMVVGAVSGMYGLFVLVSSSSFDQTSPIPSHQRWIATVGVVAVIAFLALLHSIDDLREVGWVIVGVVVLIGLVAASPLWRRLNTIDVTTAGFHRAGYSSTWHDVYVYNATGAPIVICVSTNGTCTTETRFPVRLRGPGRTVPPHDRVPLKWPTGFYGTFTLAITSALPPGARRTTSVTREESKQSPL